MLQFEADPPDNAVPVTADGELHKVILQEGAGELPPKHARCLVHYVGRLAQSGKEFMATRFESQTQEPMLIIAGRDSTPREVGLNLVVATMRCGEKCRAWVGPKYGYGERGSFSFPTVPPNARLVYDIELVQFEPPNEDQETSSMTFEERMEAAERRRQDGNTLFRCQQYSEALGKYRLALSYITEDLLLQLGDFHLDRAMAIKQPTLLNIAACQLRQEDYAGAITSCTEVLGHDRGNAKALFRRGRARHALGQTAEALADLEAAQAAEPQDGAIARELLAVRKELQEEKRVQGRIFRGYFDKATDALYDEPPPPLTPEASAGILQPPPRGAAKALQTPLKWGAAAACMVAALAVYWGWQAVASP